MVVQSGVPRDARHVVLLNVVHCHLDLWRGTRLTVEAQGMLGRQRPLVRQIRGGEPHPCPEPVSAPLGRALPPTSPPPLTPGPFSRRPIRGPPRPLQLRPYCTVPGGSQAVVPRELCQRLELRAAARREQRLSECGMRRSKTPSWDPSAERRRFPGSTKTLLRRNGTYTPHLEIIALIFQCQLKKEATEVNRGDHERDHAWKHQR